MFQFNALNISFQQLRNQFSVHDLIGFVPTTEESGHQLITWKRYINFALSFFRIKNKRDFIWQFMRE